jgi:hypothetical protein
MMKLGFTGTRKPLTGAQLDTLVAYLRSVSPVEAHCGDCVGADHVFLVLINAICPDCATIGHPPTNPGYRAHLHYSRSEPTLPYLERNQAIVDACDLLLACPAESTEQLRSGTWATVRMARKSGKPVIIILPDGSKLLESTAPSRPMFSLLLHSVSKPSEAETLPTKARIASTTS